MTNKDILEKELRPANGIAVLLIAIILALVSVAAIIASVIFENILGMLGIIGLIIFPFLLAGLKTVRPNEALVLTLFGNYHGTIKKAGFFFVHPFASVFSPAYNAAKEEASLKAAEAASKGKVTVPTIKVSKAVSLKTQTLDNGKQKVNDVLGNPIIIGAIVIWRVADPTRAVFSVENYQSYLSIQTDSTIRNTARLYPYDIFDDDETDAVQEKTLRGSALEIAANMRAELQKRVEDAGLVIEDVRITHLAYSEEIAAAMLQRQQASAIIAARQKIVDGAVGMVKMAIDKLSEDDVIILDDERKAAMVSNLLVVLCGNKDAQPIVNSGTIY